METDYTDLYEFVTNTGVVVPNIGDIKSGVQEKFRDVFGADLDVTDETPVGRLIEAITVLVRTTLGVTAQNANQFNVNTATGIYLDSLAQIYGIQRLRGTYTRARITVTATSSGCVVPAGALIQNRETYEMFRVENDIVVNALEITGHGYAVAVDPGPKAAEKGHLTVIQTGAIGWMSVTNESAVTVGRLTETDEEFRARIIDSRPIGLSFMTSVYSRVSRTKGVSSCVVYENNNAGDIYKNGVVIPGHSLYVCVLGGENDAIAKALLDTKPPGTGFKSDSISGTTGLEIEPEKVSFSETGYSSDVYLYRPEQVVVHVKVLVDVSLYTGTDVKRDVSDAVGEFLKTTGIGDAIYATKISLAITKAIPTIGVGSIQVGLGVDDDVDWGVKVALTGFQIGRASDSSTIVLTDDEEA